MNAENAPLPPTEPHEGKTIICVYIENELLRELRDQAATGHHTSQKMLGLRDFTQTFANAQNSYKDMEQQLGQAMETAKELTADFNSVHHSLQLANKRNDELHSINLALSTRLSDAPTGRRQRMADPPKFNGDREKLRNFKVQLRLKLNQEYSFRNNWHTWTLYLAFKKHGQLFTKL